MGITSVGELVFILLLAGIFGVLFVMKTDTRKEMVVMSALSLLLLPISFPFVGRFAPALTVSFDAITVPHIAIAFLLSGIAAVIFHAIFGKHYQAFPRLEFRRFDRITVESWLLRLLGLFLAFAWLHIFFRYILPEHPGTSLVLAAVATSFYMIAKRHDLLADCLASALLTASVAFFTALIAQLLASDLGTKAFAESPSLILGVPGDLLIWSIALGSLLGPMYEYIRRLDLEPHDNA